VTATATDVADFLPSDNLEAVPPTSAAYYEAVIQAFARGVAVTLREEG
jgi:hypothetical protein